MTIYARFFSLLLGLVGLVLSPAASPQTIQQAPTERSASNISESDLKSFAVAVVEVQRINDTYVSKLESAKSPEEQAQVRQAASQEMVRAVENEGMSVDKYKEILTHAQANPTVAARVQEHINEHVKPK
jgi:hypothetical protein